jgi:apolipoprotein N-acyltransferase
MINSQAMGKLLRQPWLMGIVSANLLNLPFPIAGPLPVWRNIFAWLAMVPLLYALLHPDNLQDKRWLRRSAAGAYVCGVAWYLLNCYWIYATMHTYGGLGAATSCGILLLYSMVLGLYFGLFGLLVVVAAKGFRSVLAALACAPVLWAAIEFAASRITSVPWDQLGYAQVDNYLLTQLAPFTGVYGISLVLMVGNALLAAALLGDSMHRRLRYGVGAVLFIVGLEAGCAVHPAPDPTEATAVLVQQNLSVQQQNDWIGKEWDDHTSAFTQLSKVSCTPYYAGIVETDAPLVTPDCSSSLQPKVDLVAWPESPSPFDEQDPRFRALLSTLARQTQAVVIAGNVSIDYDSANRNVYNSASFITPEGVFAGRYDKIHLVPFGEYVPYKGLFSFAGTLTAGAGHISRGTERRVFTASGRRFGIFICYESVFADEVRHFARNGAQVLVNISDDGWYGDTSAPWQHMNMARMRAIENRRWILLDTNTGVTSAVDPHGRITQSAKRHVLTSLAVRYGYRSDLTFYTRYGDVFAKLCAIIAIAVMAVALRRLMRMRPQAASPSDQEDRSPKPDVERNRIRIRSGA